MFKIVPIMKNLKFLLAVPLIALGFSFSALPTGSIHIEGDILVLDTGVPTVTVDQIEIYSDPTTMVYQSYGCYTSYCEYDIAALIGDTFSIPSLGVKVYSNVGTRWFTITLP